MTSARPDPSFWANRRVLVTGHTGFKGAWLCLLLERLGAEVSGLALSPDPDGAFAAMRPKVAGIIADIRDPGAVASAMRDIRPDIVLHLAAQALVGAGHAQPLETFATNVLGTANVLEALSHTPAAVALVVTSDKVYAGKAERFSEESALGGVDPYSASKAAAEHVAACWRARLAPAGCRVATARAGNVIGGGDMAADRLVPDVIRAWRGGQLLTLRQPRSVRPWQFVLDVCAGYLLYAHALAQADAPPSLNFGPDDAAEISSADVAAGLQRALGLEPGWRSGQAHFAETAVLRLDSRKARACLGWRAETPVEHALRYAAGWYQAAGRGEDMRRIGQAQIEEWMAA